MAHFHTAKLSSHPQKIWPHPYHHIGSAQATLTPNSAHAQGGNARCCVSYYRCSPKEEDVIQSSLALSNTRLQKQSSCRVSAWFYSLNVPASHPKSPSQAFVSNLPLSSTPAPIPSSQASLCMGTWDTGPGRSS